MTYKEILHETIKNRAFTYLVTYTGTKQIIKAFMSEDERTAMLEAFDYKEHLENEDIKNHLPLNLERYDIVDLNFETIVYVEE